MTKPHECPAVKLAVEPSVYQHYEEQRPVSSVYWDPVLNVWSVLSFDECEAVESDESTFVRSDSREAVTEETYRFIEQMQGGSRSMQLIKGEDHLKLHGGVSLALTRQVRAARTLTAQLAADYCRRLDGSVEFCTAFAEKFPTAIVTAVLGLPWVHDEQRVQLARELTTAIGLAATTLDYQGDVYRAGITAARQLTDILRPDVEVLMTRDDGNLVSEIYKTGKAIFDDWGLDDVLVQCRLLYFAGSNSSSHFLANIMYVLVSNPDLWQRLDQDRSLIPTLLEEVLRVVPPVQARPRVAIRDAVVGGQQIKAGDVLYLYNAAANRDPEHFGCPADLDLDQRPRRHLAFNAGPRACPGAPTARMEGRAVVEALLDRFDSISLDPTKSAPEFVGALNMGYMPMYLVCQPKSVALAGAE